MAIDKVFRAERVARGGVHQHQIRVVTRRDASLAGEAEALRRSTGDELSEVREGKAARRVQAKLGRASVNAIEVVQGLKPGDKVIISDVSQWDGQERLRIK